jgi:hypothetical protein
VSWLRFWTYQSRCLIKMLGSRAVLHFGRCERHVGSLARVPQVSWNVGVPAEWYRIRPLLRLEVGSVKALRLTRRAADSWESARF